MSLLLAVVEHAQHGGWLDELNELVRNPAHWAYEVISNTVFFVGGGLILRPAANKWVARHDAKHHRHNCPEDDAEVA